MIEARVKAFSRYDVGGIVAKSAIQRSCARARTYLAGMGFGVWGWERKKTKSALEAGRGDRADVQKCKCKLTTLTKLARLALADNQVYCFDRFVQQH